ncbi:NAD-dependent epimerase/dehydratase family protein [uncultured Sunxiuqinia sp.]|uniref:NAD-dependent epimerase/dehydratase family protein n=1 Tax=uncultured Sunxiuqinia sp. TaxID=1573825 RepID=UPI00260810B9|nr:NAD-dependent epimerase/dehydratase family protein [uncultured Sunxiuqinia sp.]
MKVLVTGANSLLGSNLTRKLLQAGYKVKAMVRETSNLRSLEGVCPEWFKGDFTNAAHVRQALTGCQAVIHAAANTSQWPSAYEHYKAANVDGVKRMLKESRLAGVERFILVGSANAFGPGSKSNPGNESTPFTPLQYQSGYMRSKFEAQQLALNFHQKHGFPVTVVNPTFMLGKYDAKPSSGQLLLMAYGKRQMPCPSGGKNFVHVDDVATGIVSAIERGQPGACYLLAHENLSYEAFFKKMQAVSTYPKRLIKIPKPLLSLAGTAGSCYENLTGKPAKLNSINAPLLQADNYYSPAKAVRELQLPQTPIEQAIHDALNWFNKQGYLS